MVPLGDETKQEMAAVTEAVVTKALKRRREDSPREHAVRFGASLAYGSVVLAAGIALRVLGFIGEATLALFVLAAGVVIKGESLLGFVRAYRGQNGHREPEP